MWILLRLAAFAISFVLRLHARFERAKESLILEGTKFSVTRSKNKHGQISYSVGVDFPSNALFDLHRESALDRFFKAVGFSAEFQTMDPAFDQQIYIASDHGYFLRLLRERPEIRAEILKLFQEGMSGIRSDGRRLSITRKSKGNPTSTEMLALRGLAERLSPLSGPMSARFSDPFVWKALFIEALVYGMAGYALAGIFEVFVDHRTTYPFWSTITVRSFSLGILLLAALIALTYSLIGKSSRAHRVWVEAVAVLLFAIPIAAYQITDDLNQGLDHSAIETVERPITQKWMTTHRSRGRTVRRYYFALLAPTPSTERGLSPPLVQANRGFSRLEVTPELYTQAESGDTLRLTMREGFLKVPYIERTSVKTRMPSSF